MRRYRLAAAFLALSSVLLASPALRPPPGNVLVVDASGAGQFLTIQAAVDAALDGDVVLVRPGGYDGFAIVDKALTVLGDPGVTVQSGTRVRDLGPARTVVLVNLVLYGAALSDQQLSTGLLLANDQGHVRVQNCTIRGGIGPTGDAVAVQSCADVALVACDLTGGLRSGGGGPICSVWLGGMGLAASGGSLVTVYGCAIQGGDGAPSSGCACNGSDGGDGGELNTTSLFSSNSSFHGGRGGNVQESSVFVCPWAGWGGDGIYAFQSTVRRLDSEAIGGEGGTTHPSACGPCAITGYAGSDINGTGSTFTNLPGAARRITSPNSVHAGTIEFVTLRGQPGDAVALFIADTTASAQYVAPWNGMLLVPLRGAPLGNRAMIAGTVPASGVINFPLTVPALQPGTPSRTLFLQALFTDVQGKRFLSAGRAMTVLP